MEKQGFAVPAIILAALIVARATLALWVHPARNPELEQRLAAEYAAWKAGQTQAAPAAATLADGTPLVAGEPFPFDPNTIDSAGAIRLGMPPKAVHGLLNWRNKGKHFYRPEDLRPLYNLPAEVYARIAPFIRIAEAADESDEPRYSFHNSFPAIPAIIDLNTADSGLLDRGIRGIGATLAHKIIARRTALGGYLRHEQLLEVYKFPDSTFQMLKEKLRIDAAEVRRLKVNAATEAELAAHPYIGEKTAKNIILFRGALGKYENLQQLRQVPLMTEEIYRKIAPYLTVD